MIKRFAKLTRNIESLKRVRDILNFLLSMEAAVSMSDRMEIEDLCNEIIDLVNLMEKEDE